MKINVTKFNLGEKKRWQPSVNFLRKLYQLFWKDMEGREIKRHEWMRGTAAYKLRNRWIYGMMCLSVGTGALMFFIIPKDNKLTRLIESEQEARDLKNKREMEIVAMRAEAAAMDAAEATAT